MKTAGRGNPNRWANVSGNRAHGVVGHNTSFSFKGAAKQEKFQSLEKCFLLTSPFIEPNQDGVFFESMPTSGFGLLNSAKIDIELVLHRPIETTLRSKRNCLRPC